MKSRIAVLVLLACACHEGEPEAPARHASNQPTQPERPESVAAEARAQGPASGEQGRVTQQANVPANQQTASEKAATAAPGHASPSQGKSRSDDDPTRAAATSASPEGGRAQTVAAGIFRVTPGQRFEGTATLMEQEGTDGVLNVVVEQAPPAAPYLTLLRAASCAPVGVNLQAKPAPQPSRAMPARGELIARMEVDKSGRSELRLPTSVPKLIGSALVAYAPVPAHGGEVLEPVACTVLARR